MDDTCVHGPPGVSDTRHVSPSTTGSTPETVFVPPNTYMRPLCATAQWYLRAGGRGPVVLKGFQVGMSTSSRYVDDSELPVAASSPPNTRMESAPASTAVCPDRRRGGWPYAGSVTHVSSVARFRETKSPWLSTPERMLREARRETYSSTISRRGLLTVCKQPVVESTSDTDVGCNSRLHVVVLEHGDTCTPPTAASTRRSTALNGDPATTSRSEKYTPMSTLFSAEVMRNCARGSDWFANVVSFSSVSTPITYTPWPAASKMAVEDMCPPTPNMISTPSDIILAVAFRAISSSTNDGTYWMCITHDGHVLRAPR
eukprot:Opistho-1_new@3220